MSASFLKSNYAKLLAKSIYQISAWIKLVLISPVPLLVFLICSFARPVAPSNEFRYNVLHSNDIDIGALPFNTNVKDFHFVLAISLPYYCNK